MLDIHLTYSLLSYKSRGQNNSLLLWLLTLGRIARFLVRVAKQVNVFQEILSNRCHPMYASNTSFSGNRGTTQVGRKGCISRLDAIRYVFAHYEKAKALLGVSDALGLTDTKCIKIFNQAHGGKQIDEIAGHLRDLELVNGGFSANYPANVSSTGGNQWVCAGAATFADLTTDEKDTLEGWYAQECRYYVGPNRKLAKQEVIFRSPFDLVVSGKKRALFFARDCGGSLKEYMASTGLSFMSVCS